MSEKIPYLIMPEKLPPPCFSPAEEVLHNIILMVEIGIDLKERCTIADKYITNLKLLLDQASRTLETLHTTSKFSLLQAKKLLNETTTLAVNNNIKNDYEKLSGVIDSHLNELDYLKDYELTKENNSLSYLSEKIKLLESKHKLSDNNLLPSNSSKSVKYEVDEKYPENWSRDSSIDLSTVVNLPPVPEDVFTTFSSAQKPKKSSSLSSLKSMRKVRLFLQRAETSDDEDISSDNDDHELGQKGDSDDGGFPKTFLGNITEESQEH